MTLVVILTVRREAIDQFRAFERKAAAVMAKHGGAIERTVVVGPANGKPMIESPVDQLTEVHIVTFPSDAALRAYQNDGDLKAIAYLRDQSVVDSTILIGEDGPDYRSGSD